MRLLCSPFPNGWMCGVTFLLLVSSFLAANGTKIDVGKIPNDSQLGSGSYASNYDSNDGPDEGLSGIMLGNNQPAGADAAEVTFNTLSVFSFSRSPLLLGHTK